MSSSTPPAPKRARRAPATTSSTPSKVLNMDFFRDVDLLRERFLQGKPFPYLCFQNFLNPRVASGVHQEMGHLHGTLKETDLFRVYQTGDLANADDNDPEHSEKLVNLLNLRAVINSSTFRKAVEAITGCGPLSEVVDLSANVYSQGGHLLCHDDVIGTRRVSYIIYVGDPRDTWGPEDGGRLQLYEADPDTRMPRPEPVAAIPPTFNSMAMFVVEPGVSFHSVEEVYAVGKPRCSLQGWFHVRVPAPKPRKGLSVPPKAGGGGGAAAAAAGAESRDPGPVKATLQHLLHSGGLHLPLPPSVDVNVGGEARELSPADLAELGEWVNPLFLREDYLTQIAEKCASEEGCVSLVHFLRKDVLKRLKVALFPPGGGGGGDGDGAAAAAAASAAAGGAVELGWTVVGPAHVQRFLRLEGEPTTPAQRELAWLNAQMARPSFTKYVERISCVRLTKRRACVRRFRAGSDYTVAYAHDEPTALDVTLCFVNDWAAGEGLSRDEWASGDVGGFEMYLEKEEDGVGDVAVYARDQEAPGVVCVDPAFATLSIVDRDASRMRYVKYLSKSAPSDRYDVSTTYEFEMDADEEEEDDDGHAS